MLDLKDFIRDVPDFPKKGIVFKDITTLLKNAEAFRETIQVLCEPHRERKPDAIVGIESRGFIMGGAMAYELGVPFVPARKPGKLPAETLHEEYTLEYGKDAIEIHRDAIRRGMRVLIVDDLLATGGTASATVRLVQKLGGLVVGTAFLIELAFLNGRNLLKDIPIHALISYSSE
jgi:adenine phosphoribosyltransferase